jgi:hypothetical protein
MSALPIVESMPANILGDGGEHSGDQKAGEPHRSGEPTVRSEVCQAVEEGETLPPADACEPLQGVHARPGNREACEQRWHCQQPEQRRDEGSCADRDPGGDGGVLLRKSLRRVDTGLALASARRRLGVEPWLGRIDSRLLGSGESTASIATLASLKRRHGG